MPPLVPINLPPPPSQSMLPLIPINVTPHPNQCYLPPRCSLPMNVTSPLPTNVTPPPNQSYHSSQSILPFLPINVPPPSNYCCPSSQSLSPPPPALLIFVLTFKCLELISNIITKCRGNILSSISHDHLSKASGRTV